MQLVRGLTRSQHDLIPGFVDASPIILRGGEGRFGGRIVPESRANDGVNMNPELLACESDIGPHFTITQGGSPLPTTKFSRPRPPRSRLRVAQKSELRLHVRPVPAIEPGRR